MENDIAVPALAAHAALRVRTCAIRDWLPHGRPRKPKSVIVRSGRKLYSGRGLCARAQQSMTEAPHLPCCKPLTEKTIEIAFWQPEVSNADSDRKSLRNRDWPCIQQLFLTEAPVTRLPDKVL